MPHQSLESLDLRSEEVQEVLSYIPHWIVRWGITVFCCVVVAIFVLSWVVKYPDVIRAKVIIVTQHPPVHVLTRAAGRLTQLSIYDNATVQADSILAVIDNPALLADVLRAKTLAETVQSAFLNPSTKERIRVVQALLLPTSPKLGSLHGDYSALVQGINDYRTLYQTDAVYYQRRIATLTQQLNGYNELATKLSRQHDISKREEELSRKKFDMDKGLYQKKHLSEAEINLAEGVYLSKKSAVESAGSALVSNSVQIASYQRTIVELRQQYEEKERSVTLAVQQAAARLLTAYSVWEQTYLITAPVSGTVSLTKFWATNQYVAAGEEVLAIVPGQQSIIGKITLPIAGSGKVKIGQRANIKFDSYPAQEFGSVEATIQSISLVPNNNQYVVTVVLPHGLRTTYNKNLEFKQEIQGTADIITEDLRIIERLFYQFRYLFTQHT